MTISVVIATWENWRYNYGSLDMVLRALAGNTTPPTEVIVVDNASSPDSAENTRQVCKTHDAIFLECAIPHNRGAARNIGLQHATGELIVFLDDDTIVPPTAVAVAASVAAQGCFTAGAERRYIPFDLPRKGIESLFAEKGYGGLLVISSPLPSPSRIGRAEASPGNLQKYSFFANFGAAPKELITSVGRFREDFTGWGVEDTELMYRLLQAAPFRTLYDDVLVLHLDHVSSPYMWIEHWKNQEKFFHLQRADQRVFLHKQLLQRKHAPRGDRTILLPTVQASSSTTESTSDARRRLISQLGARGKELSERHPDCSLLVHGSATTLKQPADIDVIVLAKDVQPRRFELDRGTDPPVETEFCSFPVVRSIVHEPHRLPDSWLWEISKFADAVWLSDPTGLHGALQAELAAAKCRVQRFIISYALGQIIMLDSKIRRGRCEDYYNRGAFYKNLASVWMALQWKWPSTWYYPYLYDASLQLWFQMLQRAVEWQSTSVQLEVEALLVENRERLAGIFACSEESLRSAIVYPPNLAGLEFLRREVGLHLPEFGQPLRLAPIMSPATRDGPSWARDKSANGRGR